MSVEISGRGGGGGGVVLDGGACKKMHRVGACGRGSETKWKAGSNDRRNNEVGEREIGMYNVGTGERLNK